MAISELRKTIIQIARSESGNDPNFSRDYPNAKKNPTCHDQWGTVTDNLWTTERGKYLRYGGKHLQEIMTDAVLEYNPSTWADPTKRLYILPPRNIEYHVTNLEGVLVKDMRVPQAGGRGVQWCGIFATWVLRRAFEQIKGKGKESVHWTTAGGKIQGNITYVAGNKGIQVGDVCCESGALNHHSIPIEINEKTLTMTTVNGNSTMQSILVKKGIGMGIVTGYYRLIE